MAKSCVTDANLAAPGSNAFPEAAKFALNMNAARTQLFDIPLRNLLAYQAERQKRDPNATGNDPNPFNESGLPAVQQFEGDGEADIRGGHQQTSGHRIPGPTALGR